MSASAATPRPARGPSTVRRPTRTTTAITTTVGAAALAVALGTGGPAASAAALERHVVPGATAFPEGLAAGRGDRFFTGSVVDGTLFTGTLAVERLEVFSPAGADGRAAAAGMEVDADNRLWVAGAATGKLFVYDAERRTLLHTFVLAEPESGTVNDVAISRDGHVYVTDSSTPRMWRIPTRAADRPGTTTRSPWLRIGAPIRYGTGEGVAGVNLNGLGFSPSGRALEVIQTNTGRLWRIDVATRAIRAVRVRGGTLAFGDGLVSRGRQLVLARNVAREVVVLRMGGDGRTARVTRRITRPAFAFPTAVALLGGRLLVANAQLDQAGGSPELPFTISDLAAP